MINQTRESEKTGFVFIHGAGLNGRVWSRVAENLDAPCLLAEFPCREGPAESRGGLSLAEYADCLRRQIEAWGTRRFVLVAHSLGGLPALRLASELSDRVAGFVAVGAAVPKNGGSFLSALPWPRRAIMAGILRKMGTKPPEGAIRAGLCNDLPADLAEAVVRGFVPEAVRAYTDRTDAPVPDVPRLYVKLTRDKEFGPALQNRMIANLAPHAVRTLAAGHLPMLSDPDGLRAILRRFPAEADAWRQA
ncbi:alpha/beta fold hydrolase [Cohnella massiliensis]|uniref:alpha/beta fold hydrolase n=1 Tax=Cohnella massiliensis TaxID=1816691 RepID=UPI0009BB2703|nr:alpha/beta hydrolase [Cohnella massiliensis]